MIMLVQQLTPIAMLRTFSFSLLFLICLMVVPAQAQQYQTPPEALKKLVEAPATPGVSLSPDNSVLLLMEQPGLSSIAELAEPELRLAGLRMNPRNFGPSRTRSYSGLRFLSVDDKISLIRQLSSFLDNEGGILTRVLDKSNNLLQGIKNSA